MNFLRRKVDGPVRLSCRIGGQAFLARATASASNCLTRIAVVDWLINLGGVVCQEPWLVKRASLVNLRSHRAALRTYPAR
jgi:hypothetical protein